MNAQMISQLVWQFIREFGAITKDDLIQRATAEGAKPDKCEGQIVGCWR